MSESIESLLDEALKQTKPQWGYRFGEVLRLLAARLDVLEKRPIVGEGTPREFFKDMSRWIEREMPAGGPDIGGPTKYKFTPPPPRDRREMMLGSDEPAPPDAGTQEAEAPLPEVTEPYGTPRRNRLDLNTPLELSIREVIHNVELAGCHVWLTDAVNLLAAANSAIADWIEIPGNLYRSGKPQQPTPPDAPERQEQDDLFESWWFRNKCKTKDLKVMAIHAYDAGLAAQHPGQWREAAILVAKWRDDAGRLGDSSSALFRQSAETIEHCADQLAALLPPEKEPKS